MRKLLLIFTFYAALAYPDWGMAEIIDGSLVPRGATIGAGSDISVAYLKEARLFRSQGRYELSRQAYVQALSTCRNNGNLEIIKRELAGIELLIRTMR